MIVYELTHVFQNHGSEMVCAPKGLGFFPSLEGAEQVMADYRRLPGFCSFPDGFVIRCRSVIGAFTERLYEALAYFHTEDYAEEYTLELGLFGEESEAERAIQSFRAENQLPLGGSWVLELIVNQEVIGRRSWCEGFVTERSL